MGVRSCSVRYRFASSHLRRWEDSSGGALPSWKGVREEPRREAEGERRLPALKCVLAMVTSFAMGEVGEVGCEVCEGFLRMPVDGQSALIFDGGKGGWRGVNVPLGRLAGGLPVLFASFDAMVPKLSVRSSCRATQL